MNPALGLLAAMMEPPVELEEEFNDWYDTEHIPQRVPIDGFLTLQRFVCTEGAPRYLAIYDLRSLGVLQEPGYAAISGPNTSPWSLRLGPRLRNFQRLGCEQLTPGAARLDGAGRAEGLALWHWRGLTSTDEAALPEALRAAGADLKGQLQQRCFRATSMVGAETVVDHLALVEFDRAIDSAATAAADTALAPWRARLQRANLYHRYERKA
jgi:hypothetical protein